MRERVIERLSQLSRCEYVTNYVSGLLNTDSGGGGWFLDVPEVR